MAISIQAKFTKIFLRYYFARLLRHSYQDQRKIQENFNRRTAIIPKNIDFKPVDMGNLPGIWVSSSEAAKDRLILYFHGGAYCACSVVTHREFAARMVKTTKVSLLLVDYRLAPENPYPAAVEDAIQSYQWLLEQGYPANKIIIAGDSAGGGLALATLISLREREEALPAGVFCFSPWTDLTMSGESVAQNADLELMCKPGFLRNSARTYAPEMDFSDPLLSPLFANLKGLPPLLIIAGSEETLLDDSVRFAAKAQAAGVDVKLKVWPGLFHIFPIVGYLPETKEAMAMIGEFVQRLLQET